MAFTCKTCGASFESRSDLATHQAEERKLAAESINGRLLDDLGDSDGGKPSPAVSPPPSPKPPDLTEVVIPWSHLNPIFQVLGGAAPVRFEGYGYVSDAGLRVAEVRVARRR